MGDIAMGTGPFALLERYRREAVQEVYELSELYNKPAAFFGSDEGRDDYLTIEKQEAEEAVARYCLQWNVEILEKYFGERARKRGWSEERIEKALAKHRRDRSYFNQYWPEEYK